MQKNRKLLTLAATLGVAIALWGCGDPKSSKYPELSSDAPTIKYGSGANQLADSLCVPGMASNVTTLPSPLIVIVDNTDQVDNRTVDWYVDSDRDGNPDDSNACTGGGGFANGAGGGTTYPGLAPNGGFQTTTDTVGRSIVYYAPSVPWPHRVMAYSPDFDVWVVMDIQVP